MEVMETITNTAKEKVIKNQKLLYDDLQEFAKSFKARKAEKNTIVLLYTKYCKM